MLRLSKRPRAKSFSTVFGEEQYRIFKKLDKLHDFLKKLKYEGKLFHGRNVKTVKGMLGTLKDIYAAHKIIDEKVIFPFLKKHIPRVEPVLCLLTAERTEFYNILGDCEDLLRELNSHTKTNEKTNILDQLSEKGIYAIVLIRNHIQMEIESVYKVIDKELNPSEKEQLIASLQKNMWNSRYLNPLMQ